VRLSGWTGVRKSEGVALHRERSESPRCAVSVVAGVGALCGVAIEPYLRLIFIRVRRNQETVEERVGCSGKGKVYPSLRWHQAVNMLGLIG
jgi:hypothetical protein